MTVNYCKKISTDRSCGTLNLKLNIALNIRLWLLFILLTFLILILKLIDYLLYILIFQFMTSASIYREIWVLIYTLKISAVKLLDFIQKIVHDFKLSSSLKTLYCALVRLVLEHRSFIWDHYTFVESIMI